MDHNITMKINVATERFRIAGQAPGQMEGSQPSVILCLDLTTHQRNIGIIILAFKSFLSVEAVLFPALQVSAFQ